MSSRVIISWPLLFAGCAVVFGLFTLGAQPFAVGVVSAPYDKLVHALVFGGLFVMLDRALHLPLALVIAFPLLVSLADELHQLSLPGRQAGVGDWFAGLFGILLAVLLFRRRPA